MKRVIHSIALVAMMAGGAVVTTGKAEACASPRWLHVGEICECLTSLSGYEWCGSSTYFCQLVGGGCGDKPGQLPP